MDEQPRPDSGSGWTAGKVIAVVLGFLGMAGFGVCSLCGIVISIDSQYADGFVWFLTILGIGLTALCTWLVVTMFRKAREERDRNNP